MNSYNNALKRKRDGSDTAPSPNHHHGADGLAAEREKLMSEMKALIEQNNSQMITQMRGEMDEMKQRHESEMNLMKNEHKNEISTIKSKYEGQISCLEDRCGALERSVKVLAKDVKWEYSAPAIPDSHWIDQGHDERYIEGMNWFLDDLKDKTCKMRGLRRNREFMGNIVVGDCNNFDDPTRADDERFPVVLHDDLLIPHWKEFTDAIQLYDGFAKYGCLTICNVQLKRSVIKLLSAALRTKRLSAFFLDRIDFSSSYEGLSFAVEVVKNSPKLESLYWDDIPINSLEDTKILLEGVSKHPSLQSVSLHSCCGGGLNGYELLCSILDVNGRLRGIDLQYNEIRTMGATHLPDFLATNPPLKTLHLLGNHFNDGDAALIAQALKHNTNLQALCFSPYFNAGEITTVGYRFMQKAVYDLSSLNAAASSNHTCSIWGLDSEKHDRELLNEDGSITANRARKIYTLLSKRNECGSNAHHLDEEFGDGCLKLVPKVLHCVHSCSRSQWSRNKHLKMAKPLSIMYEILRSWKMPELYQQRLCQRQLAGLCMHVNLESK